MGTGAEALEGDSFGFNEPARFGLQGTHCCEQHLWGIFPEIIKSIEVNVFRLVGWKISWSAVKPNAEAGSHNKGRRDRGRVMRLNRYLLVAFGHRVENSFPQLQLG